MGYMVIKEAIAMLAILCIALAALFASAAVGVFFGAGFGFIAAAISMTAAAILLGKKVL